MTTALGYDPGVETIDTRGVRRLALARAGLLKRSWTGLPRRASGTGKRACEAALAVIRRFGYLQLDSVPVAGARSHAIVLASRLDGFAPEVTETLLRPGTPLFEYWGHEASWLPHELYPAMAFRRAAYQVHPWWGDVLGEHRREADAILARIEAEGPLRSADFEGTDHGPWWGHRAAKRALAALWTAGMLSIRERSGFQRIYDLTERVIPEELRLRPLSEEDGLTTLLERALRGHGWATIGTLSATWRLRNMRPAVTAALERLVAEGSALPCTWITEQGRRIPGFVHPADRELAERLRTIRPRHDQGVLLSPFDPVLWDRARVDQLFDFEQTLEIYKPAPQRRYGYYCLPVLAGENLIGRVDLKADRAAGQLRVLSRHFEADPPTPANRTAMATAIDRYARSLGLEIV